MVNWCTVLYTTFSKSGGMWQSSPVSMKYANRDLSSLTTLRKHVLFSYDDQIKRENAYSMSSASEACVMAQVRSRVTSGISSLVYSYPSFMTKGLKRLYTRHDCQVETTTDWVDSRSGKNLVMP